MGTDPRYFVRTFKRDGGGSIRTAEILELRSPAAAIEEIAPPLRNADGAIALAMHVEDQVRIVLLGRAGEIPDALARLYEVGQV